MVETTLLFIHYCNTESLSPIEEAWSELLLLTVHYWTYNLQLPTQAHTHTHETVHITAHSLHTLRNTHIHRHRQYEKHTNTFHTGTHVYVQYMNTVHTYTTRKYINNYTGALSHKVHSHSSAHTSTSTGIVHTFTHILKSI